jgi:hypothetical protein
LFWSDPSPSSLCNQTEHNHQFAKNVSKMPKIDTLRTFHF